MIVRINATESHNLCPDDLPSNLNSIVLPVENKTIVKSPIIETKEDKLVEIITNNELLDSKETGSGSSNNVIQKITTKKGKKSFRPSFSEQLKVLSEKTDLILQDLKMNNESLVRKEEALLELPSKSLIVGKLTSKFPSVIRCYRTYLSYLFYHPYESKEIEMNMYFEHMTSVMFLSQKRKFQFKINHGLGMRITIHKSSIADKFGSDYLFAKHNLEIEFNSNFDMDQFQKTVKQYLRT